MITRVILIFHFSFSKKERFGILPPYGNTRFGYLPTSFDVLLMYLESTFLLPSRYFLFTKGVFLLIFVPYGLLTDYCSLRFQNCNLAFVKF